MCSYWDSVLLWCQGRSPCLRGNHLEGRCYKVLLHPSPRGLRLVLATSLSRIVLNSVTCTLRSPSWILFWKVHDIACNIVWDFDVLNHAGWRPSPLMRFKGKASSPVVYPFALVKPSGAQGELTLNDINRSIMIPSPRPPHRQASGDDERSASHSGAGLSGKSVVACTKIHTEGNGTITIMRTRGWGFSLLGRIVLERGGCEASLEEVIPSLVGTITDSVTKRTHVYWFLFSFVKTS